MSRVQTYIDYLRKKPGDRFAMYSLALEYRKAGDLEAAERAFSDLLAAHPTSGAGYFQFGSLYADVGRPDDAARVWRQGLAALRGATDPEAIRSIGEIERALALLE